MNPLPTLYGTVWAITDQYFRVIAHLMESRRAEIENRLADGEIEPRERFYLVSDTGERIAASDRSRASKQRPAVAVVPVLGPVEYRQSLIGEFCGWASSQVIAQTVEELVADSSVKAILLDVDSPGGVASGLPESAKRVYDARGTKPIVAVANTLAASASYWLPAAADQLYASPSAEVGSIGVFSVHYDESKALEMEGVKPTIIKAGKFKAEGNPFEPLSDEARDYEQSVVDGLYSDFLHAIGKYRNKSVAVVRSDFGEGRTVGAPRAAEIGMTDGTQTFQQVLSKLVNGKINMNTIRSGQKAQDIADGALIPMLVSEGKRRRFWMRG